MTPANRPPLAEDPDAKLHPFMFRLDPRYANQPIAVVIAARWKRQPRRIEATYETHAQYHNPMEPHAIVASWNGDAMSIDTQSQGLAMAQGGSPDCSVLRPRKFPGPSPTRCGTRPGSGCVVSRSVSTISRCLRRIDVSLPAAAGATAGAQSGMAFLRIAIPPDLLFKA